MKLIINAVIFFIIIMQTIGTEMLLNSHLIRFFFYSKKFNGTEYALVNKLSN